VPIIATDLPEFHELVQDGCGIILSQHDPEELAKTISYVLDHSNLINDLKEKNLNFAQERTWDKIAMSFVELYEQVIGSTLPPRAHDVQGEFSQVVSKHDLT